MADGHGVWLEWPVLHSTVICTMVYLYKCIFLFFHVSHPPFCCAADMNNELILKNKVL